MSEKLLSEQLFDLAGDCLDDPLRIIGGKVAQLEAENEQLEEHNKFLEQCIEKADIGIAKLQAEVRSKD